MNQVLGMQRSLEQSPTQPKALAQSKGNVGRTQKGYREGGEQLQWGSNQPSEKGVSWRPCSVETREKNSEVSSGWVGLSPAGNEQARAPGQGDSKGAVTCQQRSALSLTALGCEGKAPGCGQWGRLEGYWRPPWLCGRGSEPVQDSHELSEGRVQQAVWPLGKREASGTKNGRSLKSAEKPSSQPERVQSSL